MPLITRRSSTRGLPRVSLGRSGASRANWSSVSQKPSRIIIRPPLETVNHKIAPTGILMGPDSRETRKSKQLVGYILQLLSKCCVLTLT
jgi:hypothetical protein